MGYILLWHSSKLFSQLDIVWISCLLSFFCCIELSYPIIVNPATFHCEESSPISDSLWSNGSPNVALTHIFCGQIKRDDKGGVRACGFHSRPNNQDPVCARACGSHNDYGVIRCYEAVEVWDEYTEQWVPRSELENGFCFFPASWSIVDTVTNLQAIFNHCHDYIYKENNALRICGRNYKNLGFDVMLILQDSKNHNYYETGDPMKLRVVTAYPTPITMGANICTSEYECNLEKLGQLEFFRWLLQEE